MICLEMVPMRLCNRHIKLTTLLWLHIMPRLHPIHVVVSTCIRIQVARPGYLYTLLHVSGVNAALVNNLR